MKSSMNDMAFRVWTYFLGFIGSMLIVLWMLQITFLEPFYKTSRTKNMGFVVGEVERLMTEMETSELRPELRSLFAKENMCGIVYDRNGFNVMSIAVEIMGQNCYLSQLSTASKKDYISYVENAPEQEIDVPFRNEYFEQSMSFYGKKFIIEETEYYIFINTPMELLDSTVNILKNQFLGVSLLVFSLGTITSLLLARKLAYPIQVMNISAKRLAQGDFSVIFSGDGYTEAIELSKTLNYATEEFSKTDELRRDLVANVSHDIKTPLTMIKAYAEMIVDISGDDKELRNQHLNVILDETKHLEKLVNDMLSLSQYESKVLTIHESRFNLKDHIESTLNLFRGLNVKFKISVKPSLFVLADEIKMGQVLYNYINNAIMHSKSEGVIEIKAKDKKSHIEVSVIDFGQGISLEDQELIWDRYAQINKHHTRNESTSGLGLAIVAAICEACNSEYGVESKPNEGSRFYYTLKKDTH